MQTVRISKHHQLDALHEEVREVINPPLTTLTCNNSVLCLSVVKSPRHDFVGENVRNALIRTKASLFFPVNS